MIVVPAVDLRGGEVVRLRQGRAEEKTVYGTDPASAARRWAGEGAQRLHVVDLDAAFGQAPQEAAVAAILAAVAIPVEIGGGIRSLEQARRWIARGAERVIFGTAAVQDPESVKAAAAEWGPRVAVAIDARDGQVAVEGWTRTERLPAVELAGRVAGWGVTRVQYTDVGRDGSLTGLDTAAIARLAAAAPLRLTVGGGVHALSDLTALRALAVPGVDEVIVGRALYDARFSLAQAREACA